MTENATCSVDVEIGEIEALSVEVESGNAINVEIQQLQGGGGGKDAVLYVEQELTEEEQAQARKNIGAIATSEEIVAALGYTPADNAETDGIKQNVETLSEKVKDIEADSELTAEKIEDALGYKPADANNVGVDGSYIITGVYELREDGRYLVFTEDNFSWQTLVKAVYDDKYVGCVLYDDNRDYPICFSLGGAWFDDGYVVFNAIHENGWVYELRVFDSGSALLQKYNTRNYIITGTYTPSEDGSKIESVTLDDSFDYDEMVAAIKAGRYVAVRLVEEIDRFYHEMFSLKYWSAEENYVVFTQHSTTSIMELKIGVVGGNYQVHLTEREISGGGGTAIDLLWEEPLLEIGSVGWSKDVTIVLPNLIGYDQVEIHHISDDQYYSSTRFDIDTLGEWTGQLSMTWNGSRDIDAESREVNLEWRDGTPTLHLWASVNSIGHPVRIYGIKGVSKKSVASLFTIIAGNEAERLTFMRGMTWGEWCASKYNTYGLSINSDGDVRLEADDSFVSFDGVIQKSDFLITAGAEYDIV